MWAGRSHCSNRAAVISCAQQPVQHLLLVPYYTEICELLYPLAKWSGMALFLYFFPAATDFPWESGGVPLLSRPLPCSLPQVPPHSPCPTLPRLSSFSACRLLAVTVQKRGCDQSSERGRGRGRMESQGAQSPGGSSGCGTGRQAERAAGRGVDPIVVWLWNAKNDRKEPVRLVCCIFLHPKGFSSLLLVGQAPRSCVADGERGPWLWPSGFPLDHECTGVAQCGRWEGFMCSSEHSLEMTAASCTRKKGEKNAHFK